KRATAQREEGLRVATVGALSSPATLTRRPDVHRALRRGPGGETRRSENVVGHALPRGTARRHALAPLPAVGMGARSLRAGTESVPRPLARLHPHLPQPAHAGRLGYVVRRAVSLAHRIRTGRVRGRPGG